MNEPAVTGLPRARLLVVVDDSDDGVRIGAIAVALATRFGAELLFLIAIPVQHIEAGSPGEMASAVAANRKQWEDHVAPRFQAVMRLANDAGVAARTELSVDEHPCDAVLRVAAERRCEVIVVGTKGRGALSQVIQASLAGDLVRQSPWPVIVCRDDMTLGSDGAARGDDRRAST